MSDTEQERVKQIRNNTLEGRFVWDPLNKVVRDADHRDPDDPSLKATVADMGHSFDYRG